MTSKIGSLILLTAGILMSADLFAQVAKIKTKRDRPRLPSWVSGKGYWVVESNIHSPYRHTVLFYNNDNELMYRETLQAIKLNAEKRRTKMKLKKALETSALTWQARKDLPAGRPVDHSIVMMALK